MEIDKYKLKLMMFTCELDGSLDRNMRTIIITEAEIKDVSYPDNQDGTYDEVYKAQVVGSTTVDQNGNLAKGKSKRSQSKKIRQCCWKDDPSEEYYEWFTNGVLVHYEEIKQLLEDRSPFDSTHPES